MCVVAKSVHLQRVNRTNSNGKGKMKIHFLKKLFQCCCCCSVYLFFFNHCSVTLYENQILIFLFASTVASLQWVYSFCFYRISYLHPIVYLLLSLFLSKQPHSILYLLCLLLINTFIAFPFQFFGMFSLQNNNQLLVLLNGLKKS